MGEFQNWQPQPNGFSIEDELFPPSSITSLSSSSSSVNPNPLSIGDECWSVAEQRTREIICRIQPTVVSEQRRKVVTEYVQWLIRNRLGSEVFPFGSVPLKTYLPDGDIDLTALSYQNVEDALANDVRNVLEVEERNNAAEFIVKDVQYINAEVKLVKCLVQNIVVDISFNQVGGLSTLCFLEKVDHLIRKDHLFKRSIILIKAWCYYESRILGAHHGLISTYALETLVLYIFHLFHSSLNGPLAVLYRFLDYYSKFDWDNYCISLNGPVGLASLPEIVVETPENGGDGLLLSNEFLKSCADMFSVPSKGLEGNARSFPQKHLNIIDPLKENNNLGRSVSKGNFYRIRSAFTYGARKLGRILLLPGESIGDELNNFFMNTLDRHGSGQRPDVQDPVPFSGANEPNPGCSKSGIERSASSRNASVLPFVCFNGTTDKAVHDPPELLGNRISDMRVAGVEENPGIEFAYEAQKHNAVVGTSLRSEIGVQNGISVSEYRLGGDAKDLASFRNHSQRNASETEQDASSSVRRAYDASHVYISQSPRENAKISSLNLDRINSTNTGILDNKRTTSMLPRPPEEQNGHISLRTNATTNDPIGSHCDNEDSITFSSTDRTLISGRSATISEEACHSSSEVDPLDTDGAPNTLSDLGGDYNSHLRSLQYGQWCYGGFYGPPMPVPPPPPSQFHNKHGWDSFHQQMPLKYNVFPHMSANGAISGHQFYPPNSSINSGATFGVEEIPKPRGTGTYFPNMNHRSYRDKPMPGKGRNPAPATHGNMQRPHRENGWPVTPSETNTSRESESIQRHFPGFSNRGTSEPVEFYQAGHSGVRGFSHSNGFSQPEKLRSGNVGHLPLASPPVDLSKQPSSSAPQTQVSPSSVPALTTQRPKPSLSIDTERIAVESYHLRDDDFPPLSV